LRTTPIPGPDTTPQGKTRGQAHTEPAGPSACVTGPTSLDQAHGPDGPRWSAALDQGRAAGPTGWSRAWTNAASSSSWTIAAWSSAWTNAAWSTRTVVPGPGPGNGWSRPVVQLGGRGPGACGAGTWSRNSWTRPRAPIVQEWSGSLAHAGPGWQDAHFGRSAAQASDGLARRYLLVHGGGRLVGWRERRSRPRRHAGTARLRRVTATTQTGRPCKRPAEWWGLGVTGAATAT
jgi:hypothetical protein